MKRLNTGNKKFEKTVGKQAKKIVASAMEVEEADNEAFIARVDAAIKKRGSSENSTAAVVKKKDTTEQDVGDSKKAAKLSSIIG